MNSRRRVPVVPSRRWSEIGKISERFIEAVYPELLKTPTHFPLDYFLEFKMRKCLGFDYDVQDLPDHIEATTDPRERVVVLAEQTYDDLVSGVPRARFTVAHEIGHIILHAKFLQELIIAEKGVLKLQRGEIPAYRDPECQANALASSLLMPTIHVVKLIETGKSYKDMADIFNVSYEAAKNRINNIHLFLK